MASAIFVVSVSGYADRALYVVCCMEAATGIARLWFQLWGKMSMAQRHSSLHGPITSNIENHCHIIIILVQSCAKIADRCFNRW